MTQYTARRRTAQVVTVNTPGETLPFLDVDPIHHPGFDNSTRFDDERTVYQEARRKSVADMRATTETLFPHDLVSLLAALVAGDIPSEPIGIA